ncbi:MAG: 1-acyl-sn-glycerol-3-phosphate acyltransferase [Chloroflexi bacterium]|nr:1-acyl-sn-glycerol-3-phosphate acyltransferase [Chloroflexota bacterium]
MDVLSHEKLPNGPALFAANHPSTTDPIFIQLISRQPMSVMIASKVFSIPFLGPYMRRMQQIPVIPGRGEEALAQASQALEAGRSVAIFPEGEISPADGGFHNPRSGAARLALKSGVPVAPLGIYLSEKHCKRIRATLEGKPDLVAWYLRGPYAITIGKAMKFHGSAADMPLVRSVSETIMQSIRSLAQESRRRALAWAVQPDYRVLRK